MSQASRVYEDSLQVQRSSERKCPELEPVPPEPGTNEVSTGSLQPLASYMQLPDSWSRFHRLRPWHLQGFQHRGLSWERKMQESRIHQHPRDTWASIRWQLSDRLLTVTCCILTVSLMQSLARCRMKTTLASMGLSTPSSVAPREAIPPLSGGSELISDLFRGATACYTESQQCTNGPRT